MAPADVRQKTWLIILKSATFKSLGVSYRSWFSPFKSPKFGRPKGTVINPRRWPSMQLALRSFPRNGLRRLHLTSTTRPIGEHQRTSMTWCIRFSTAWRAPALVLIWGFPARHGDTPMDGRFIWAPCFLFPEWCFSFPWGHFSRIGFLLSPWCFFCFGRCFSCRGPGICFFCPWNWFECYRNGFFCSPWYFRCPEGFFLCPTEMKCPRVFLVPVSFWQYRFRSVV